jgi:hypothetical protein
MDKNVREIENNSAIDQNKIIIKNPNFFFRIRCVEDETMVAYIVSSKSYTRNLLVVLILFNSHFYVQNCRFAHFFVHLQPIRSKFKKCSPFEVYQLLGLLHSENKVSGISKEKALYQNVQKHPFSAHLIRLLTPEAKI